MAMTTNVPQAADEETVLRHKVSAVTLLLVAEGILGYSGHVSVRLPGRDGFLIQPVDQSRAALRPEHLLVCDMDGRAPADAAASPPSEVFIHTEIFRARPDVNAIAHFHHELTTTFSLVEDTPLVPVKNHAMRWRSGIPVHPDPDHVNTPAKGRALVQTLGPHHAAIIRAHGEVVVAESLEALLADCVHLVENAETLFRALTIGTLKPLTEAEMATFEGSMKRGKHALKLWSYYLGKAEAAGAVPREFMPYLR